MTDLGLSERSSEATEARSVEPMCPPANPPVPRFEVKLKRSFTRTWKGWAPIRLYYGSDGDWTNQHIWFGVEWMERGYGDELASIGLDCVIPPKLFWLINLLRLP